MLKKHFTLVLVFAVLNLFLVSSVSANTKESKKKAEHAEKVKAGIAKLGTGPDAKIEVRLYDKTKIKGYVSESDDDSFVVVDAKTGEKKEVAYSAAKQVKGNNLSEGMKILIGVAIIAAIGIIVAVSLGNEN